ncbi:hypothetical protein Ddc_15802 [Ditylenchus destructor]|nr:hypothetical protein Ddc_15802 [Ditylenchus destructor]
MGGPFALARTKSELILDSRGVDIRPTGGFTLHRIQSSPNVTRERAVWNERYKPEWISSVTAYTPAQSYRYVCNSYNGHPAVSWNRESRFSNCYNWYDRYSRYPPSYSPDWLTRRYYIRGYLPHRRTFGYPNTGYSDYLYSPQPSYLLTGLAF